MASKNPLICQAQGRLKQYEAEVRELWKADHKGATACLAFENTLRLGVRLYDGLIKVDAEIRSAVLNNGRSRKALKASRDLFESWLKPCERVELRLQAFTGRGYELMDAQPFLERCAEAHRMLSESSEAFEHDAIVESASKIGSKTGFAAA